LLYAFIATGIATGISTGATLARVAIAVSGLNTSFDPKIGAQCAKQPQAGEQQPDEETENKDVLTGATSVLIP
jgi:hypothetical protein